MSDPSKNGAIGPDPAHRGYPFDPPSTAEEHARSWWECWIDAVEKWYPLVCRRARGRHDRDDRIQTYLLAAWRRTLQLARRGPIQRDQWGAAMYRTAVSVLCKRDNPGGLCARRPPGFAPGPDAQPRSDRLPYELAQRARDIDLPCPGVCPLADWDQPCRVGRQLDPAVRVQMALDWAHIVMRLSDRAQRAVALLAAGYSRVDAAALSGISDAYLGRLRRRLRAHWAALITGA